MNTDTNTAEPRPAEPNKDIISHQLPLII